MGDRHFDKRLGKVLFVAAWALGEGLARAEDAASKVPGGSGMEKITLAEKPPMGWNSWDCYGTSVTEAEVRANAEAMKRELAAFGWEYVVVDIQWYEPLAKAGGYRPNAV